MLLTRVEAAGKWRGRHGEAEGGPGLLLAGRVARHAAQPEPQFPQPQLVISCTPRVRGRICFSRFYFACC